MKSKLEAEAKERQMEGGVEGGEIAGRGRPKENRLPQLIGEAYVEIDLIDKGVATLFAMLQFATLLPMSKLI